MSKYQIIGFIVFNIGLIFTGVFLGQLAFRYEIEILHLLPLIGSLLIMLMGLITIAFGKVPEKVKNKAKSS
ncbi:membrane protein DedA with SNARE-associated domain [Desulfitispora alkaliphila]|uniref:hypothetical protein n=1 Tax=Desulfitispora alkaliphila TaxID=622674 RepID=UPI003D1AFDFC